MKLSLVREKLVKSLSLVLRMISNQVTLPILSNVLLTSDKGRLKISATDLEVGIETWVGAKIIKEGSVTVPAKLLFDLVSSISSEKIDIEQKDNKITIKSKDTKSVLKGLSATDFPLIPKIKKPLATIDIQADKFKKSILKNVFACATDETRPVLNGIVFKVESDKFVLAATDSYRLTESTIEHKEKVSKPTQVIIPKRTMTELARIIPENEEKIQIKVGENQIAFKMTDIYFISRLIEGSFPEYDQIIPKKFKTKIYAQKDNFIDHLKTASLFSRDSANNITIETKKDENKTVVNSYSQQLGENKSSIEVDKIEGEDVKIAINSTYLLDVLNILENNEIEIKTFDQQSPIYVRSKDDKEYFCIIMPLRQEE